MGEREMQRKREKQAKSRNGQVKQWEHTERAYMTRWARTQLSTVLANLAPGCYHQRQEMGAGCFSEPVKIGSRVPGSQAVRCRSRNLADTERQENGDSREDGKGMSSFRGGANSME